MTAKLSMCNHTARVIQQLRTSALAFMVAYMLFFIGIHLLFIVMVCITSFISSFSAVGFSGSRLGGSLSVLSAQAFLPLVSGYTGSVGVGCAWGVDAAVRSAFSSAVVFRVAAPVTRASFALRSSKLVHWVAAASGLLIAFPLGAAPSQLRPCVSFAGHGSGTWGSVALALGLGVQVLVVLPSSTGGVFPAPVSVASRFTPVGIAPCGGYLWHGV